MTDRELLTLAAKAYWGSEIDDVCSIRWLDADQCIGYTHGDNQDHNGVDREFLWNPLRDDGDALRLAVKLKMALDIGEDEMVRAYAHGATQGHGVDLSPATDSCSATRRAIVYAASELGKVMP